MSLLSKNFNIKERRKQKFKGYCANIPMNDLTYYGVTVENVRPKVVKLNNFRWQIKIKLHRSDQRSDKLIDMFHKKTQFQQPVFKSF